MKTTQFPGSRWWKFDFHTHTPASSDYANQGKSISARDWLIAHHKRGLDCVVITDHNSGQWFDNLCAALQTLREEDPKFVEFFILPGVEISCSGGVHLLAILDTQKTSSDIAALVGACGYRGTLGSSDAVTDQSASNVIDTIHAYGAIAIAAHCDMPKGLLVAISDATTLKQVLEKIDGLQVVLPSTLSALVTDTPCLKLLKNKPHVQGSDSHNANYTASNVFTWVKMGTPSLDGLRLALVEPELSIIRSDSQSEQPLPTPTQWIESLCVEHLAKRRQSPMVIQFNPWLNTVIGGRGSGKSTLVECLRLALGRGSEVQSMLGEGHEVSRAITRFNEGMLLNTDKLKTHLTATVRGAGSASERDRYTWTHGGVTAQHQTLDAQWISADNVNADNIAMRFPIRVFSQKQIHALANETGGLLQYFDEPSKANKPQWQKEFELCKTSFLEARREVRQLRTALQDWPAVKDGLATAQRDLDYYAKQGIHQTLQQYQKLRTEKRAVSDFLEGLQQTVASRLERLAPLELSEWALPDDILNSPVGLALKSQLLEQRRVLQSRWELLITNAQEMRAQVDSLITLATYQPWQRDIQEQEQMLADKLAEAKTQLGGQLTQVTALQQKKESLEHQNKTFEATQIKLNQALESCNSRYRELELCRQRLQAQRTAFVQAVLTKSNNQLLKIDVLAAADWNDETKQTFIENLRLNGQTAYVEEFVEVVVASIIKDAERALNKLGELKHELQQWVEQPSGSKPDTLFGSPVSQRLKTALQAFDLERLDAMWTWFPEDKVVVQFRSAPNSNWQDLSQGSAGQQTGALLSFILTEGTEPLILDQPEDDLDNAMVYEVLVQQLRENKSHRQVIVVTHNPNIVVNGDAELIIPMSMAGGQIQNEYRGTAAGGLQESCIRQTVCSIMEGGRSAFEKRYQRLYEHAKEAR